MSNIQSKTNAITLVSHTITHCRQNGSEKRRQLKRSKKNATKQHDPSWEESDIHFLIFIPQQYTTVIYVYLMMDCYLMLTEC